MKKMTIIATVWVLMTGCCKTITQEQLRDIQRSNKVTLDSLARVKTKEVTVHDSVYIYNNVYTHGDTVFVEKYKVKYNTLIQSNTDTIFHIKTVTDTVYKEKELVSEKTIKERSKFDKIWYLFASICGLGVLIFLFGGIYVWIRNKINDRPTTLRY